MLFYSKSTFEKKDYRQEDGSGVKEKVSVDFFGGGMRCFWKWGGSVEFSGYD